MHLRDAIPSGQFPSEASRRGREPVASVRIPVPFLLRTRGAARLALYTLPGADGSGTLDLAEGGTLRFDSSDFFSSRRVRKGAHDYDRNDIGRRVRVSVWYRPNDGRQHAEGRLAERAFRSALGDGFQRGPFPRRERHRARRPAPNSTTRTPASSACTKSIAGRTTASARRNGSPRSSPVQ